MSKALKIAVLNDRYPTRFMTPRRSRHNIFRQRFVPMRYLSGPLDGMAVMQPVIGADLVHIHNRIPIGARKFVIDFESHLPRSFSLKEDSAASHYMYRKLVSPNCRRIIAMSHYAARCFQDQNEHLDEWQDLKRKLIVRYPNIVVKDTPDQLAGDDCEELVLTFVGGHFARKGGCVALRVAERALQLGLPIKLNIISSLNMGGAIWTDPSIEGFFDPYLELLSLPNVTHYGAMPNDEVRAILGRSHFGMLPTFADSFGFSAPEGMAEHTPVIATRVCALPEYVKDGYNGFLFDIKTNSLGEWDHPGWDKRGEKVFADFFTDEVEQLTDKIIEKLQGVIGRPDILLPMRKNARYAAETLFDTRRLSPSWDRLYDVVAAEDIHDPVALPEVYDFDAPVTEHQALA